MNPNEIAEFLHHLCDVAERETLSRFRCNTAVSNKLDNVYDPVTEADRAAERIIRAEIKSRYPDHGIIGEEYGSENPEAEHCWILDPIDGTRSFISGLPLWGTLIGLYHNGAPAAGIMHQPFTSERFICTGKKSYLERSGSSQLLSSSHTANLDEAILMTTSPYLFSHEESRIYKKVENRCLMARYGADCYAYCLLAMGSVDLVIESGLNIYDIAALIPIVEGAGGIITSWRGDTANNGGPVVAAANKGLHEQVMELINSA